jgi:hypothetical protein
VKRPGGLLYRWFGFGKLPAAVRMQIAGEQVLFSSEGIHAVTTFSGHVPGFTAGTAKQFHVGAFVVTDRRVVGTCGKSKTVDVPYDLPAADGPRCSCSSLMGYASCGTWIACILPVAARWSCTSRWRSRTRIWSDSRSGG